MSRAEAGDALKTFQPTPTGPLPFPSILVASTDDPWIEIDRARTLATAWGSYFVDAGPQGHLNAASGIGWWEEGQALLDRVLDAASDRDSRPKSTAEARTLLAVSATEASQAHYLGTERGLAR